MATFPYAGFLDGQAYPSIGAGGTTVNVANSSALTTALTNAAPGQRIVLANGTYSGSFSLASKVGTATSPISVEAATTGGAIFASGSTFSVTGSSAYVTLKGLVFPYELSAASNVVQFRGTSHHCRVTRCLFGPTSIGTPGANKTPFIYMGDDTNFIRIDHCEIRNKANPGNAILGDGNFTTFQAVQHIRIDHNLIRDIRPEVDNEKEPIRLGVSTMSKTASNSVIERNVFVNCICEPEVISVKCDNVRVTGNTVLRSIGGIVYRHGRNGVVNDNYIVDRVQTFGTTIGSGGLRFYDAGHEVAYNYVDGVYGGNFQNALMLDSGDAEGSSTNLAAHWRVVNALVERNVLVGNPTGIVIGHNYSLAPTGCTIRDNLVASAGTGLAVTQKIAPVSTTQANNLYGSTPAAVSLTQTSDTIWRRPAYGPRLTYLQAADVGISGDVNDADGTGTLFVDGGGGGPVTPAAAPVFVATGAAASGSSTSMSVPAPAGVVAGDFQVAVITVTASETISGIPSGWQLLDSQMVTSPTSPNRGGPAIAAAYYSTGSSTGAVSFTKSGTGFWHAVRSAWRGVDSLGQHTVRAVPAGSPLATPAVNPTRANSLVVAMTAADLPSTPAGPYSPPSGWIERYDTTRTSGSDNLSIAIAEVGASPTGNAVVAARDVPVSPAGSLGQFNLSSSSYIAGFRFEFAQPRTIDRWYFTINGEGSNLIGGRTGYGNGNGGTWFGRIVAVNQATGLPTSTVLASETVAAATAHQRAITEFGLNLTHQIHWVQFPPVTITEGTLYAFLLSNTDSNPGSGGSAATGNHMSINCNFAVLAQMGPNGENNLNPQAGGAMYGYTPRETTLWSANGGSTWRFGDQVGWYQLGSGEGRMWGCGYRLSNGTSYGHGWPFVNWPSDVTSPATVTYADVPAATTITRAGGANDGSGSIGAITVTNTTTGQSSSTPALGSGVQIGTLATPVTVGMGQSYRLSATGRVGMGSPTSGHGDIYGLGARAPWKYTLSTGNQVPMLFALPHPFLLD